MYVPYLNMMFSFITNWKDVFSMHIGHGERHLMLGITINGSPTKTLDTGSNLEDM